jgi:putative transposase
MNENRVVLLRQPDEIDDPLTEILRSRAKRLVQQVVEAEFAAFMGRHGDLELPDGRQRVVRHGHDPVRPIQTALGRSRCRSRRRVIAGRRRRTNAFAMRRRFCRNGRGGRRASTFFCRLFICAASPLATFRTC